MDIDMAFSEGYSDDEGQQDLFMEEVDAHFVEEDGLRFLEQHVGQQELFTEEVDGGHNRRQPASIWRDQQGEELTTSKHNEFDKLVSMPPTGGRGITSIDRFNSETCNAATDLIKEAVTFDQCESSVGSTTLKQQGELRLDNQGDVPESDGSRFANLQLQIGNCTVANALIEIRPKFGKKRIRRALIQSLNSQKVVRLFKVYKQYYNS